MRRTAGDDNCRGGDGPLERIVLENARGMRAVVLPRGATLAELHVPDRDGVLGDVVLGFESAPDYERASGYVGCVVGRVANRIAGARFRLDGESIQLSANEGKHHLHGGESGLDRKTFEPVEQHPDRVRLRAESPDGDQGYPGRLEVRVVYALGDDALRIDLEAESDRKTPVNLSHHAYWNLATPAHGNVLGHLLRTPATHYLPTDESLIPTGELALVAGTRFDFQEGTTLGARLASGYDSHLVLPAGPPGLRFAAELHEPTSGRTLELHTTQPGFQLYTGQHLDGSRGKAGIPNDAYRGVCLEPQHPPNAANEPSFPSIILAPGDLYRQTILLRFTTR